MLTFSNPRIQAEFTDWPLGGSKRGRCIFTVEHDAKRGYRFVRQTTGKPKTKTYGGRGVIVDGANGRTYLVQEAGQYDFITISRSDFLNADSKEIGCAASVFPQDENYTALKELINSVYHVK